MRRRSGTVHLFPAKEGIDPASKWCFEDQGLKRRDPLVFRAIAKQLNASRDQREKRVQLLAEKLDHACQAAGLAAEINGRPKHISSIFKKMDKKKLNFDQIFDLNGIRMVVDSQKHCYQGLDLVHQLWRPLEDSFDDYIRFPKPSGYQSLHTTIILPDTSLVEVQIRSRSMHWVAEYGQAAHWHYKQQVYS